MLQSESFCTISDNTTVAFVKCILRKRIIIHFGSLCRASIQKIIPAPLIKKRLRVFKPGQLCLIVILTTRSPFRRCDSIKMCSTYNTGCLLASDFSPIGSRIKGIIFREIAFLRPKCRKLLSISEYIY